MIKLLESVDDILKATDPFAVIAHYRGSLAELKETYTIPVLQDFLVCLRIAADESCVKNPMLFYRIVDLMVVVGLHCCRGDLQEVKRLQRMLRSPKKPNETTLHARIYVDALLTVPEAKRILPALQSAMDRVWFFRNKAVETALRYISIVIHESTVIGVVDWQETLGYSFILYCLQDMMNSRKISKENRLAIASLADFVNTFVKEYALVPVMLKFTSWYPRRGFISCEYLHLDINKTISFMTKLSFTNSGDDPVEFEKKMWALCELFNRFAVSGAFKTIPELMYVSIQSPLGVLFGLDNLSFFSKACLYAMDQALKFGRQ